MSKLLIYITHKRAYTFAGFLVLYQFLTYIANDMIMPGMIHVVETFNGPESAIATSLTAYVLGGASLQLFLGPLSDRYGRRPVMLVGAVLFFLFTIIIGLSQSMEQFLIARFFQGMGLCFIGVIGYTTLQEIFTEMDAVRLIAILSNISTIAPLLGPLVGATFIIYLSWRAVFWVIGGLALVSLYGLWRYMPESIGVVKKDGSVNMPISFTPNVIARNYWLLFKNKVFLLRCIALGLLAAPCLAWIAISPIMLITDAHFSMLQYGLWQIPIFTMDITGNFVLRHLTYAYTIPQIIIFGSMVTISGLLLSVLLIFVMNYSSLAVIFGLMVYGLGLGITTGPLSRQILYSTEVSKGTTSALMSIICMVIQAFAVETINYIYRSHNNLHFTVFCLGCGVVYLICYVFSRDSIDEKLSNSTIS